MHYGTVAVGIIRMSDGFDDEQIRVELKRLVENARCEIVAKMRAAEVQTIPVSEPIEDHGISLSEKMDQGEAKLSLRIQQMIDFIDRR